MRSWVGFSADLIKASGSRPISRSVSGLGLKAGFVYLTELLPGLTLGFRVWLGWGKVRPCGSRSSGCFKPSGLVLQVLRHGLGFGVYNLG